MEPPAVMHRLRSAYGLVVLERILYSITPLSLMRSMPSTGIV
jgi:hypothetical protein